MDLDALTPEQLHALKQQLGLVASDQPYGWSPMFSQGVHPQNPRQLMDLTIKPDAKDPRPTFFWSAERSRNAPDLTKTTIYPRLMWDATSGKEITVGDRTAEQTMTAKGFVLTKPSTAEEPDLKAQIDAQLAQLSPADRAMLIEAAQQDRLGKIRALMAGLSSDELTALRGEVGAPVASEPVRGAASPPPRKEKA